jgi:Icc-related predicted phosphoesterase
MILHVLSDIHLEKKYYKPFDIPITDSDAIVLAGDIHNGFDNTSSFLLELAQTHQKPVFYTLGNNCVYEQDYFNIRDTWRNANLDSINYLDAGIHISFMDHNFYGASLWPMYDDMSEQEKIDDDTVSHSEHHKNPLNQDGTFMSHLDFIKDTKNSLNQLKKSISLTSNNVVVTHFAPSFKSCHPDYSSTSLNGAHANTLDDYISSADISLWIHGHVHHRVDYMIGNTRILANPCSPNQINKYEGIVPNFCIEL